MGRQSTKSNKNIYFKIRDEELHFTRAMAAELMPSVKENRIEEIEYGKRQAEPEDVVEMAEAYKRPDLCNYYCSNECPIGKKYVPKVTSTGILSDIVLKLLANTNEFETEKDKLINITSDGDISDNELEDFVRIENCLERAELSIHSIRLWTEKMAADGKIDKEKFNMLKNKTSEK